MGLRWKVIIFFLSLSREEDKEGKAQVNSDLESSQPYFSQLARANTTFFWYYYWVEAKREKKGEGKEKKRIPSYLPNHIYFDSLNETIKIGS